MKKRVKIRFFSNGLNLSLKNRTRLKTYLERILNSEGKKLGAINYIFCTDKELLNLNSKFLKHNYYTDILTFDLSDSKIKISAEIYISLERVIENAQQIKNPIYKELHRVIFHGILHLCGFSDKTRPQIKKMRKIEDKYLALYFK